MKYEEMSDFEINEKVFDEIFKDKGGGPDYVEGTGSVLNLVGYVTHLGAHGMPDERQEKYGEIDYCNNPSDAWPIIFDNKISLDITDTHTAAIGGDNHCYIHTNPLRAAIIVFLKMQEKSQ